VQEVNEEQPHANTRMRSSAQTHAHTICTRGVVQGGHEKQPHVHMQEFKHINTHTSSHRHTHTHTRGGVAQEGHEEQPHVQRHQNEHHSQDDDVQHKLACVHLCVCVRACVCVYVCVCV